mgnify:CR=1 FL=1
MSIQPVVLGDIARWIERHFFSKGVHRSTSSGTVHAYLPVVLDDTGKLGASLIDFTNDVQAKDATLTSIAALGTAADKTLYTTAIDTWAETPLTAFGRSLIDDADAAAARTTLDAQQLDAELTAIAGLTSAADRAPYFTGLGTAALATLTAYGRSLIAAATAAAARTVLELGTMALETATNYLKRDGTTTLTADWDIGTGRKISGDKLAARAAAGLVLTDDGDNQAIYIADGGKAIVFGDGTGAPFIGIDGAAGSVRQLVFRSAGLNRWILNVSSEAESGSNAGSNLQLWSRTDAGGALSTSVIVVDRATGFVGIGITPQGPLHVHNGTGGKMFVTKTGIVGAAQTIIPDAAGDVTKVLWGQVLVHDGTTVTAANLTMTPGGANVDVVAGTVTLRFTIAAAGNLTVIRQAGAGTGVCAFFGFWL